MAKILPIASGKGGVGKTFFSANLGIILSRMGQKVVLVDLDLGGSNLHTTLGIKNDILGLGHYINDKNLDFKNIIHATEYPNLKFVPGDALYLGTANLQHLRKKKLMSEITKIEADWVILDLGAGTTNNTLDFFLLSNCGLLITNSEITSILNLYSFVKNAFYRYILLKYDKKDKVKEELINASRLRLEKEDLRLAEFLRLLKKDYPEAEKTLNNIIDNFFPKIILNRGRGTTDIKLGENLRSIIHKNLGIDVEYIGFLPEEPLASESIINRRPISITNKDSKWVEGVRKIAGRLLEFNDYPRTIFEFDVDSLDVVYSDLESSEIEKKQINLH